MTRKAFVEAIQEHLNLKGISAPTEAIEDVFRATIDVMSAKLADGEDIQIKGFGSFRVVDRAERIGRHPGTGETMQIPFSRTVKFTPGMPLKDAVNVM